MMERTWITSAFVDLRGFGTWIYRASIPKEIKEPFIVGYLEIVQGYVKSRNDIHFKYLGDGFLAIKEFTLYERKNGAIVDFIKGLRCATRKIMRLIRDCERPPDGVRVRVTCGYAYKVMVVDPCDQTRETMVSEFIEYGINTAERLMEVNPDVLCIVTEDVAKALGRRGGSIFGMRPLGPPSFYPKSVNREDLEALAVLRF